MERLDKFLCDCGAGTRSQVKLFIKAGRVTVGGVVQKDSGAKVDPARDTVLLDGVQQKAAGRLVLMLHKPAGYVTATEDKEEKTVMQLLPAAYRYLDLKPVGRLDKQTEGLLLFTNDGALLHALISPKKQVEKQYYAKHGGKANDEDVQAFAQGLTLKDGTQCLPAKLTPLGDGESCVTVCEGKYHQVRRMLASRGMHVEYLKRLREGKLTLGDLPLGQVRELTPEEIENLF